MKDATGRHGPQVLTGAQAYRDASLLLPAADDEQVR